MIGNLFGNGNDRRSDNATVHLVTRLINPDHDVRFAIGFYQLDCLMLVSVEGLAQRLDGNKPFGFESSQQFLADISHTGGIYRVQIVGTAIIQSLVEIVEDRQHHFCQVQVGVHLVLFYLGGMTALGFFFPIVGLILYLVWKDQTPLKAHSAGKGALIGVIVWTALSIILAILAYVIPLLVFYSYY